MKLAKLFRILSVASAISLLSACGSGPKITTCLSDPELSGVDCTDSKKKTFFLPYSETNQYQCLSPEDTRTLLTFCRTNDGSGSHELKVTFCASHPGLGGLDCVDPDLKETFLPYALSENFTCLSLDDTRSLLEFCKTNESNTANLKGTIYGQCSGPQIRTESASSSL